MGKCCGIQSEYDWHHIESFEGQNTKPLSCCPGKVDASTCQIGGVHSDENYVIGCTDTGLNMAKYPLIALTLFQILAIISSGALRRQIRRENYYY